MLILNKSPHLAENYTENYTENYKTIVITTNTFILKIFYQLD
jgi:hypothetical protein